MASKAGKPLVRVVSGGQTGVDRAALDAALRLGIPHGGWCPKGRRAEDGRLPTRLRLDETPSSRYAQRTRWNVRDSDATLVLLRGAAIGGTALTINAAAKAGKPCLVVDLGAETLSPRDVARWIEEHRVKTLNVAGPRESQRPGIYEQALRFLVESLAAYAPAPPREE